MNGTSAGLSLSPGMLTVAVSIIAVSIIAVDMIAVK